MARYPTLDEIEAKPDVAWRERKRLRRPYERYSPPLGGHGCWCGNPHPWHKWPGKQAGLPHPRREC